MTLQRLFYDYAGLVPNPGQRDGLEPSSALR